MIDCVNYATCMHYWLIMIVYIVCTETEDKMKIKLLGGSNPKDWSGRFCRFKLLEKQSIPNKKLHDAWLGLPLHSQWMHKLMVNHSRHTHVNHVMHMHQKLKTDSQYFWTLPMDIQKLWVASKWDPHQNVLIPNIAELKAPHVLRRHGLTPWRAWVKSWTPNLDRFLWPMVFATITKHQLKNIFQVTTIGKQ